MLVNCSYALTNTTAFAIRHYFFAQASDFVHSQQSHGPTYILGDFNARLYGRRSHEENWIGAGVFGGSPGVVDPTSNSEVLLELCAGANYVLSHTFFAHSPDRLVTYRNFGVPPLANITVGDFAQLDFILSHVSYANSVLYAWSDRTLALQTQHFCLLVDLAIYIPKTSKRSVSRSVDLHSLLDDRDGNRFCESYLRHLSDKLPVNGSIDNSAQNVCKSLEEAAEVLPTKVAQVKRPWISSRTLALID